VLSWLHQCWRQHRRNGFQRANCFAGKSSLSLGNRVQRAKFWKWPGVVARWQLQLAWSARDCNTTVSDENRGGLIRRQSKTSSWFSNEPGLPPSIFNVADSNSEWWTVISRSNSQSGFPWSATWTVERWCPVKFPFSSSGAAVGSKTLLSVSSFQGSLTPIRRSRWRARTSLVSLPLTEMLTPPPRWAWLWRRGFHEHLADGGVADEWPAP